MNEKEFKMIKDFPFFLWATLVYALFYVVCLYKNGSGITFPFFTVGTVTYFILCMKKLEAKMKPYSIFYMSCILLLGLSTCLTDSWIIIFFNKITIFFLIVLFLLHSFYEDKNWKFTGFLKAYFITVFVPIAYVYKPFSHLIHYRKMRKEIGIENKNKNKNALYVFVGILISIPLLCVILSLLISSDMIFENMFKRMYFEILFSTLIVDGFFTSILFVVVFLCAYMLVSFLSNYRMDNMEKEEKKGEPILAITISSILSVVYIIFCSIQVIYLFLGRSTGLSLPDGMIYSEYAREGFFQLLFVCIINLVLVLLGIYLFRESKVLKTFLCIITSCTFIMIVSSALRMILYIQHQYLTFLRVFVLWALLVILLVMIGVMIAIFKKDFPLFRYSTTLFIILYLFLSFGKVDYFVAKVNVDNMRLETQYEFFKGTELYDDEDYLMRNLSLDAAKVIIDYKEEEVKGETSYYNQRREDYISYILYETNDMEIRNLNVSRYIAREKAELNSK